MFFECFSKFKSGTVWERMFLIQKFGVGGLLMKNWCPSCNCQTTSKHTCGPSTRCSCRQNGLKCVAACGNCRGTECENIDREVVPTEDHANLNQEFDDNIFENLFGV